MSLRQEGGTSVSESHPITVLIRAISSVLMLGTQNANLIGYQLPRLSGD